MKIYIGADHRGFEMKEELVSWLQEAGHEVVDCGNDQLDPEDDFVDYGFAVAKKVAADATDESRGIGICGSGIGMSIAANRVKGVRCGLSHNAKHVEHARQNDHINMLALASEWVSLDEAKEIITAFLNTEMSPKEKYARRAQKLDNA